MIAHTATKEAPKVSKFSAGTSEASPVRRFDFQALIDGVSKTHTVRVVTIDGAPWFVVADVCKTLGYRVTHAGKANVTDATRALSADELGFVSIETSPGTHKPYTIYRTVSESGLYKLIMRSNKPAAKPFQEWVTREVLPSIRKTGGYMLPEGEPIPLPPDFASALRQNAAMSLKLAEELEAHARTKAEAEAARAAKRQAEDELGRVSQVVGKTKKRIGHLGRYLPGLNSNLIKRDLKNLGYFYRLNSASPYRVYHQFREKLFTERVNEYFGTVDIYVTEDGLKEVAKLYTEGKLTLLKGHVIEEPVLP